LNDNDRQNAEIGNTISDEDREWDSRDRIPSEIFEAIKALNGGKTQTETMQMRERAIKRFLSLMEREDPANLSWTIYDRLAIKAWMKGDLPPKPRRGAKSPSHQTAFISRYVKKLLRLEYATLRAKCPDASSNDVLVALAEETGNDIEWLNNVIRSSNHAINEGFPDHLDFPDMIDMWLEWEESQSE